jgi:F-type H+-transporting ATPase subunit delta
MLNQKISTRYAISLMDLAMEKNSLETLYNDVKLVVSAFDGNAQFRKVLINPIIKPKMKLGVLDEVFAGRISEDLHKFMRFILEKNREAYLYAIMKSFLELRNDKLGIVEVGVTTAVDFNEKQTEDLKGKLEKLLGKKVELNFTINKNILGGFIARVGDTLYDASIKNQLVNLKKQFLQSGTF